MDTLNICLKTPDKIQKNRSQFNHPGLRLRKNPKYGKFKKVHDLKNFWDVFSCSFLRHKFRVPTKGILGVSYISQSFKTLSCSCARSPLIFHLLDFSSPPMFPFNTYFIDNQTKPKLRVRSIAWVPVSSHPAILSIASMSMTSHSN